MPQADPTPHIPSDLPPDASINKTPVSTVDPDTNKQPVANPSEEAKQTYRKTLADGYPLEINERPARIASLVGDVGEFKPETAQDRADAQAERMKADAKAKK